MPRIDDTNLREILEHRGLLSGGRDAARIESAGSGNINFVRRVRLADGTSFVVKHARPTLERFPQYAAPVERLLFEHRYVERVKELLGRESLLPRILHFDETLPLLVLEDLGPGPDLDSALAAGAVPLDALRELGGFLASVHVASAPRAAELVLLFENMGMQALHGEHIFALPYQPNDFPLDPAIRQAADRILRHAGLHERIAKLRALYYEERRALVHADVQSSNLLLRGGRLRLLDAEIAHFGDPAFDLGTALAHVWVHAAIDPERSDVRAAADALLESYAKAGGSDEALARAPAHAGVEMLRRTIGAARFARGTDPAAAERILAYGARLVSNARI
jgi:5-methylthioribose kinase